MALRSAIDVHRRGQITAGLLKKYGPQRVKDTPITEVHLAKTVMDLFDRGCVGWVYGNWRGSCVLWPETHCGIYDV